MTLACSLFSVMWQVKPGKRRVFSELAEKNFPSHLAFEKGEFNLIC